MRSATRYIYIYIYTRGSKLQDPWETMTCFVFATHTVCLTKEIKERDSQVEKKEKKEKERKERKDRGQSFHGVRSTERPIFFHSFSFLPSRVPVGPSVLSSSVFVESRRIHAFHLPSWLLSFFCTDRPPSAFCPSFPLREVLFPWSPASRACVLPFFCRIFPIPLFLAILRDAGVVQRLTRTEKEIHGAHRNYGECKVVRLMKL